MNLFNTASIALAIGLAAAPAMAEDIYFGLTNASGLTLMEFYATPIDVSDWGADILGTEVVAPGESGTVTISDGSTLCDYDFRMVFEDGSELEVTTNICDNESYTIQ